MDQTVVSYREDGREIVTRRIGGELLIIPVVHKVGDLDAIYSLNEVGARIWELIVDERPLSQILATLAAEYDATPEQLDEDVNAFLATLEAQKLIRLRRSTES